MVVQEAEVGRRASAALCCSNSTLSSLSLSPTHASVSSLKGEGLAHCVPSTCVLCQCHAKGRMSGAAVEIDPMTFVMVRKPTIH